MLRKTHENMQQKGWGIVFCSALLWPAWGSLARPGTNCPSGNQLTDPSASHWSAMTVILKNLIKKKSSSSCCLPRAKDAKHFTHKELAKHSHQGNHQRCCGISGLQRGRLWLIVNDTFGKPTHYNSISL